MLVTKKNTCESWLCLQLGAGGHRKGCAPSWMRTASWWTWCGWTQRPSTVPSLGRASTHWSFLANHVRTTPPTSPPPQSLTCSSSTHHAGCWLTPRDLWVSFCWKICIVWFMALLYLLFFVFNILLLVLICKQISMSKSVCLSCLK